MARARPGRGDPAAAGLHARHARGPRGLKKERKHTTQGRELLRINRRGLLRDFKADGTYTDLLAVMRECKQVVLDAQKDAGPPKPIFAAPLWLQPATPVERLQLACLVVVCLVCTSAWWQMVVALELV